MLSTSDDGTCAYTSFAAVGGVLETAGGGAPEMVCDALLLAYNDDALAETCEAVLFVDWDDAKEAPRAT